MSSIQLDTNTQNKDVGIVLTECVPFELPGTSDVQLAHTYNFIKTTVASTIIWYFSETDQYNVITLEAGEFILTPFDKIIYTHTFDKAGTPTPYTTTASVEYFIGVTSGIIGGDAAKARQ
jgi:hypothetical protein